jgi:hypothetical protein
MEEAQEMYVEEEEEEEEVPVKENKKEVKMAALTRC